MVSNAVWQSVVHLRCHKFVYELAVIAGNIVRGIVELHVLISALASLLCYLAGLGRVSSHSILRYTNKVARFQLKVHLSG